MLNKRINEDYYRLGVPKIRQLKNPTLLLSWIFVRGCSCCRLSRMGGRPSNEKVWVMGARVFYELHTTSNIGRRTLWIDINYEVKMRSMPNNVAFESPRLIRT